MASVPSHTYRHSLPLSKSHFILLDILMNFLKESEHGLPVLKNAELLSFRSQKLAIA